MTTPTDWQTLCAELADSVELLLEMRPTNAKPMAITEDRLSRARTALAPQGHHGVGDCQTEPEGLPPDYIDAEHSGSDREMLEVFYRACRQEGGTADEIHLRGLKVVLARWGRPAIEPVPVSERPWERDGWCDAEGKCWFYRPAEIPCRLANGTLRRWVLDTPYRDGDPVHDTHSLPHHALPVPVSEQDA